MNTDVVALAGVFYFALWCLYCRSFSLSASLVLNISPSVLRASEGRKCDRLFPLSPRLVHIIDGPGPGVGLVVCYCGG